MSLLILLLVMSALTLLVQVLQWWRIDRLAERVAKLEAQQAQCLSGVEVRQIFDRLGAIDGRIDTTTRLMQTIQEHLLENDR